MGATVLQAKASPCTARSVIASIPTGVEFNTFLHLQEENEGLRAQAEASGAAAGHEAPGEASQLRSEKRRLEAEGAAIRERLMAFERGEGLSGLGLQMWGV